MSDQSGSVNDQVVQAIEAVAGARNISQAELARRLGLKPPAFNLYLTPNMAKRRILRMDLVGRIAEALGVTLTQLICVHMQTVPDLMQRHLSGPPV